MANFPAIKSPLRIGILGCANIARQFCAALKDCRMARVDAVGSRTSATASAFAADQGIGRFHASYEALLEDPLLDAIYLPLPNSMHMEWAIKAAQAGKHILCEKPMALNLTEASAMFDAASANGVMLLEAFPWYFQPQTRELVSLLQEGTIGQVRTVQASFGFTMPHPQGNIRMNPELGGGALLDAGSYALSMIRLAMGEAPMKVMSQAQWADTGVDISMMATLFYANGRCAQLACAMDIANHRRAILIGTQGIVDTEFLNHTSEQVPSQLRLRRGTGFNIPFENIPSAMGNGFRFAAEAFAQVIAARDFAAIERAAAASRDNAATLDALARSAKLNQMVEL